jgi:acyl transferase domain-containing protein
MKAQPLPMDVAIIGFSGMFPRADDTEQFWQNLADGLDAITEIPENRFDFKLFFDSSPHKPGKICSKWGGFLDGPEAFDFSFFRVNKREAKHMDPQQRLFCEQAWKAFEHAGYSMQDLGEERTGVFVGVSNQEYVYRLRENRNAVTHSSVIGTGRAFIANRISHILDLKGPSLTLDSACSSSLLAVHQAINALLVKDCEIALAGGVNLILDPFAHQGLSQMGVLSPTGRCRVFDKQADGFVRGEGVGAVVLKLLDKAIEDRDSIHAVIKNSTVSHHGKNHDITSPSLKSQISLLKQSYTTSGICPETITYVEAGSSGTRLGDPIEIRALKTVFTEYTDKHHYCAIGSVKNNVGHLEAASGICALIKILLAFDHKKIPATINYSKSNKFINFDDSPFFITRHLVDWDANGVPRRAGLTSFGFGGTDLHMILEEYNMEDKASPITGDHQIRIFTMSARKKTSFARLKQDYIDRLDKNGAMQIDDICYTATRGRSHFNEFRFSSLINSRTELLEDLRNLEPAQCRVSRKSIVMIFSARRLDLRLVKYWFDDLEPFKKHCGQAKKIYRSLDPPLKSFSTSFIDKECHLKEARVIANFIFKYSISKTLFDLGIRPDLFAGAGHGEYAAGCAAELLELRDAIEIVRFHLEIEHLYAHKGAINTSLWEDKLSELEEKLKNKFSEVGWQQPKVPIVSISTKGRISKSPGGGYCPEHIVSRTDSGDVLPSETDQDWMALEIGPRIDVQNWRDYQIIGGDAVVQKNLNTIYDLEVILPSALVALYQAGVDVDWAVYQQKNKSRRVALPTYPFEREKCWIEKSESEKRRVGILQGSS